VDTSASEGELILKEKGSGGNRTPAKVKCVVGNMAKA